MERELGDIDYSDIEAKYEVPFDDSLDNVIIINGIPVITSAKQQKLFEAIQKRFRTQAEIEVPLECMHIQYGDSGESKGYILMELASGDEASHAIRTMDGYAFDKKHHFVVTRFSDIERLVNMDETYVDPEEEPYKQRGHLRSWLADPAGRDQLAICVGDDVQIAWHNRSSNPQVAHSRTRWTESYVQWSPLGTYLATFHLQGIALWGGAAWERIMRYPHPGVRLVDFSPDEKYMVTWSPEPIQVPENAPQGPQFFAPEDEGNRVAVWEVRTGHLLRTFPIQQEEQLADGPPVKGFSWPFLKWSGDSKYCAKVTPGKFISVYQVPSMGLLDQKSIKVEGVVDFEWCPLGDKDKEALEIWNDGKNKDLPKSFKKPRDNMLCFWQPEVVNQPARVTVMSLPTREVLRSKNLFNVADCKLHWHPQGDYLCVKVDRQTKTKKTVFCNFELFRMREKDFPVEVVELKDPVIAFAWEPQGSHFAVISSNDPNFGVVAPGISLKTQLNFYHLHPRGNFRMLKSFDNKTCSSLFWSPRGRHLLTATLGSTQKFELEWYDVDFNNEARQNANNPDVLEEVKQIGNAEHYSMTDVEWDPSGRYVTTSASLWRRSTEHGYAIWDFRGTELQKHIIEQFKQILWRPRPKTLLSKEDQKRVRRNLKEFSKVFDQEDEAEESSQALAHREVYQRMVEEWKAWRARNREELENAKKEFNTDTAGPSAEQLQKESTEEVQEWVEEVLEETEEAV